MPPDPTEPPAPQDRASLEIEKLALEVHRLRLEVDRGLHSDFWTWAGRASPIIATLLAVVGFLSGVKQYSDRQQQQSRQEIESRDREFLRPLWERELGLFFRASEGVASIATSKPGPARQPAEAEFWKLYHGPLAIVESREISGAMVQFGMCLDGTANCDQGDLEARSKALATAFQKKVEDSTKLRLSEYSKDKFQYH